MDSLIVRNLTKKFGSLTAVDNISFNVKKGSIFAFLGPNGAGKSTSIKMFTTLLWPDSGSISLEGINVLKNQNDARRNFAVVFQDQSLDDKLTAYENMKFHAILYDVPGSDRESRIHKALEIVGLTDRKGDLVETFSGGMKRRLEIGRGLIHHPKVLFLDEPTTGLDPQTRNSIWQHILQLNRKEGMTIFMTTHYMEEAEEMADRVAIIDHGRIIEQGTVKELKKRTGSRTLEQTFLKLTGKGIRQEHARGIDRMRMVRRIRR